LVHPQTPVCLYCERSSREVALIPLLFGDSQYYICPQHLPILIHKPSQLKDKLPGAENMGAAEGHDHE
jgi:hypothetical protein